MSRIERLPLELRQWVMGFLYDPDEYPKDFYNARATCRALHEASWIVFGKALRDRHFKLHPRSLGLLLDLSNVKELAPHVDTLTFSTERFWQQGATWLEERGLTAQTEAEHNQWVATWSTYDMLYNEQKEMDEADGAVQMLEAAFSNFTQLRTILLNFPKQSETVYPLWPGVGKGNRKLLRRAQTKLRRLYLTTEHLVFLSTILEGVSLAQIPLRELAVRKYSISIDALDPRPWTLRTRRLVMGPATHLTKLKLRLNAKYQDDGIVTSFVRMFHNLEELDISFPWEHYFGRFDLGRRDLYEPNFSSFAATVLLPNLRDFRLECLFLEAEDLITFLRNHKCTLQRVALDDVQLDSSWVPILRLAALELSLKRLLVIGGDSDHKQQVDLSLFPAAAPHVLFEMFHNDTVERYWPISCQARRRINQDPELRFWI